MTMPSFIAVGTGSETAPTPPTGHAADDLLLLMMETAGETPNASTGGTWTRSTLTGSRADTKLTLDRRFATSGAESNAGISATANHLWGVMAAFRNVDMTNPFAATACSQFAATTSGFSPKMHVPVDGTLVVCIITGALDATTLSVSAAANTSLANVAIRTGEAADTAGTVTGNGGCVAIITGELASAGDVEPFTWTQTSTGCSVTMIALRPNAEIVAADSITIAGSPAPNGTDVVTIFNLTNPADPPIEGIDVSGGAGGFSSFVRYSGHTYYARYRSGTSFGASDNWTAP